MADSALFVHERRVGWGDTDAARIVYTARVSYFGMEAIEAWFLDRLGADWFTLNRVHGYGTPFVHMEIDFRAPMAPPQVLHTTVRLARVGRSSLSFALSSVNAETGVLCWEGRFTCAFIDAVAFRSIPVPEMFRAAVMREVALSG